jgi:aspartokinase/homoserine dehydrogenase 1
VGADFYDRLGDAVDGKLRRSVEAARSKAFVLRYVGSLTAKEAFAGLQQFPADHPFAAIRGSDNVIAFTTDRYSRTPLVLQGPGAGAQVTAMGVFSDILKLASYLPY